MVHNVSERCQWSKKQYFFEDRACNFGDMLADKHTDRHVHRNTALTARRSNANPEFRVNSRVMQKVWRDGVMVRASNL